VVPLGRNIWNESRRVLQQVAGLGNDVRGITSAVSGVLNDLVQIESNYEALTIDPKDPTPLGKAIEKTGQANQLLNNVHNIQTNAGAIGDTANQNFNIVTGRYLPK